MASSSALRRYALPLLAAVLSGCGSRESPMDRSLRQAALAHPRPVEGRLSVAVRFARWGKSPVAPRHDPAPFSDGEDKRVLRGSRPALGKHEPEELHRIGLLSLYHGDAARAVSELEVAAERKPSAAVLSDLAAAYLALAEEDRPWLRVDAIAAATRAVQRAPREPYAAFNLALALERTSLAHEAGLAWERYLTLENDDEWHKEASARLARLRQPTARDRWETAKAQVVSAAAAGDRKTLTRLTRQFPRQTKELLEGELLAAWADAVGTEAAEARLATAKRVAETLADSGERLYVDAIGVIESRHDASKTLAEGHKAYAQGLLVRGDCSEAMPEFERALERLSAERSPMAKAARYQQLVCIYRSHPPEAEASLAELASELKSLPYPTLLANTEAMLGLCAMADGRHSEAIAHYERSVQLLARIGDTDVRRSYGMLDEAYRFLGDRDASWRYRLEALRSAVAAGDRQICHGILVGLVQDLIDEGRLEVAQTVLAEMLANARA
jgi:tetratricopeptide (TPR) repeat protein